MARPGLAGADRGQAGIGFNGKGGGRWHMSGSFRLGNGNCGNWSFGDRAGFVCCWVRGRVGVLLAMVGSCGVVALADRRGRIGLAGSLPGPGFGVSP
jgi:hypothetical protein